MATEQEPNKEFTRQNVALDFAKLTELIVKDLNNSRSSSSQFKTYTKENVITYISNPLRYAKELQGMSNYLYNASPHYRRLVNYYAKMATLDFYVEPYGIDTSKNVNVKSLRSNYQKAIDLVESMNIKHEYGKIMVSLWKLGTFYGYELFTKDSYFIFELPFDYCQISGIYDGVMTFSFDLGYFDKNSDKLELYPKEFQKMYNKFKNGSAEQWQEVDPAKSVCLKLNEEVFYDIPPFAGIFTNIFDIEDYKSLRKINEVLSTYKFIVEKIPIRDKSEKNNDFSIDLKTVGVFHNKTANLLPDEVGIFSTPFEIETVEFSKDNTNRNAVEEAENGFYTSSGTSQLLFNSSKSSQTGLGKSINVDEAEVFLVYRQIERLISLKLKEQIKGTFKFRLRLLDNTIFNKKDNTETLLQNAQYGLPVKTMLGASLGLNPSAIVSMSYLENEVLGLNDLFIPLASSHTQSGSGQDEKSGRPETEDEELSEKGEAQREREDNANRSQ